MGHPLYTVRLQNVKIAASELYLLIASLIFDRP